MSDAEDRALSAALRGLVTDPAVPDALADRVATGYARRRRRRAGATAAATALGVGVIAVAPSLARPARTDRPLVTTTASPTVSPSRVPLPKGPMVAANGLVVARPDDSVRFCPPRVQTLELRDPPVSEPPSCGWGVPAFNVDLGALRDRQEQDGTVWGYAWLKGVYADGTLTVAEQAGAGPGGDGPRPTDDRLPCEAPPGGWQAGPQPSLGAANDYADENPGQVVHLRYGRPVPRAALVVVAVIDPEPAEAALRPVYGDRVCIVKSRYTREQVAAARKAVSDHMTRYGGISSGAGYTFSRDGQVAINLEADVMTPELAALLDQHPEGLIQPTFWLGPVEE